MFFKGPWCLSVYQCTFHFGKFEKIHKLNSFTNKKTYHTSNLGSILSFWNSRCIWQIYLFGKNTIKFLNFEYNIDYPKLQNHWNLCTEVMWIWGLMEINYKILVFVMILKMFCWSHIAWIIATFCLNIYVTRTKSNISDGINFNFCDATFFSIPNGSCKLKAQSTFFFHIFIFIDY
jgi:hypothetical protein